MRVPTIIFLITFVCLPALAGELRPEQRLEMHISSLYRDLGFAEGRAPDFEVFRKGLIGFYNLKEKNKLADKHILTLIDFSLSSNIKRMWIINLRERRVLVHTLVAHGKNTGEEYAKSFSNTPHSNQSSLGFYVTGKTYYGKHGLSLRLHGMEPNFNDKAESRAIVLHGAEYVSPDFIKQHGRLGRSQGCPAVPMEDYKSIIELIADKTCLFIYHTESSYHKASKLQDLAMAASYVQKNELFVTVQDVIPSGL